MMKFASLLIAGLVLCGAAAAQAEEYERGSWDLNLIGGGITESFGGGDETLYFGGVQLEYFLLNDLSLGAEALGYSVDQQEPDSAAFGFSMFLRYNFWKPMDNLAVFVEGSVGIFEADHRTPSPDGSHHNFTAMGGVGAKLQITESLSLIAAGRYFHLSNANMHGEERNPSIDGFGGYAGLSISF